MEAIYQPETQFTTFQKGWGRHNSKYSNVNEHLKKRDSEEGSSTFLRNFCNHASNQKASKLEYKHRYKTSASDTSAFLQSVCHTTGFLGWGISARHDDYDYDNIWYDIFVNCNWVATRWQQCSTHLHTNNKQNDSKQTIHRTTQKLECGPCPIFAGFTLAFALQMGKKHGKTSVRVAEECQLVRRRYINIQ